MEGRPTTGVTSVPFVWTQDVVGRPTTYVRSVTLCGPRIWRKGQLQVAYCFARYSDFTILSMRELPGYMR